MTVHTGFKKKLNAESYAGKMRKKGYKCSVYKAKTGWSVGVYR